MSITNPLQGRRAHASRPAVGPQIALAGALAVVLGVAILVRQTLAGDALLPAVSLLLFVLAAAVAPLAWLRVPPERQFSYADLAGVLAFIGICVAALVEPEQLVRLVEGANNRN